ncbi:lysophospholipid acyltransferase family protein [Chitinibacter sp. FCG-7]|uniref:Lysophospholipid acyltransferase family protein n=1 Tax=Chitinibacter mangrovi TaxID=3153927 RepID=A0AAU7FDQ0_9NEIS
MSLRSIQRALQLAAHITIGLCLIRFAFPRKTGQQQAEITRRWSEKLANILNIQIVSSGLKPELTPKNQMCLANHISWFDIFALNAIFNSRFIAKADVAHWPVVGSLCKGAGTFFINREKIKDTKRINDSITQSLKQGECITFFPEGTTSNGVELKPLKTSLLQSIVESQGLIQPIYINYRKACGAHCQEAAYIDDISFGQSLAALLKADGISVHVHFLDAIHTDGQNRAQLSAQVQTALHYAHQNFMRQLVDKRVLPQQQMSADLPAATQ